MIRKVLTIFLLLMTSLTCGAQVFTREVPQDMRTIFFCIVSSAENSSLDFKAQYAFIKDIGDGRGYTAGVIGFTSGTGDMLEVVKRYIALKPIDNPLAKYLPALEKVNGTPSHKGLGKKFVNAWRLAARDKEMFLAQDSVLDAMYYNPALYYAEKDGLTLSVRSFITMRWWCTALATTRTVLAESVKPPSPHPVRLRKVATRRNGSPRFWLRAQSL